MKRIRQTYHIKAPVKKVWQALTEPAVIEKWGGGPARMDDRAGAKFELWGGDIHGTNTEVVKEQKLVQDWFGGNWPEPSRVTFTLKEENGETTVTLIHENVPEEELDDFKQGWKDYYLGAIKELLEGGE